MELAQKKQIEKPVKSFSQHGGNKDHTMEYYTKEFTINGDETGSLIAVEAFKDIPFAIQRVYYVYGTTRYTVRGRHSHKLLEQIIFCPIGSCDFILDNGKTRTIIPMNMPNKALYIKGNIWREFTNFSENCVVMVLASLPYDTKDYIHDYEEFLRTAREEHDPPISANAKQ